MRTLTTWLCILAFSSLLWPTGCLPDEIVLKSGERFTSDRIWEENGKIRFNMQGLLVSVDPGDVVSVTRQNPAPGPSPRKKSVRSPDAAPSKPKGQRRPDTSPQKPAPRKAANNKAPSDNSRENPRVHGIGMDGIQWQMPPDTIPGIEKGKTEPAFGGITQYHRTEGSLRMGEALLDGLVFGFWRNRLYTITIWVEGKPAYERLRKAVFHRHGKGQKSKSVPERYVWLEKTTDRMLEFDDQLNTGIFWMRSRELDQFIKQRHPDA